MKEVCTTIFISLFFVFTTLNTFAQRSNGIAVEGKITVEDGSPEAAIIQMYQDGKRLDNYGVSTDGRYKVELNYNHKYELVFQCEGNFQQKIVIEADVPKSILDTDPKFPPFPVNINLFAEIPGIDKSFSENTVLKIFYSPSVDNFVPELYYNDAQIKRLIEQAVLQGQVVDKRADYMSKLTRAELAELRKEYNKLLEQAGNEYSSEKFLAALDGYKAASRIMPEEQFPKDRIAEINDLLGLIMAAEDLDKAKLARFNALVKEGDLFFNQTLYDDAKISYDRALSIKPFDQYVNDQLKKIADLLNQHLKAEEYNNLIAQGDNALKELLYTEAIGQFQQALEIRPNEQYPKNKIDEINGLLANQLKDQEQQQNYDDAMFEGEKQFTKQFYDRALTSFQNALSYRPNDPKATRRIEETQKVMQEILDKMSYDKFIAIADKAYKKKDYPEALTNYEEALALFPNEPRTKKRVEEINQILYAERSFAEFVSQGDKQFEAKSYSNAKSLYEKARDINSSDKHVLAQITTINSLLAQQGVDEQYNQTIAQADDLLAKNEYENARGKYNEAIAIKSKEKYPKDKIAEIGRVLAGIAKTDKAYQDAIAKADNAFQQKDYTSAKTAFVNAGSIKPGETYPPEMITKITDLEAEQAQLLAQQQADEKVRLEAHAAAEVAKLATIQAEKDKNYTEAITRADNLFNEKNYENARNEYRVALDVKPEEVYPQQRIDEIGTLMAELSAAQKTYEEAISKADREFGRESFDAAIVAYNEAKQAKADETYPDEQIAKINGIIAERARLAEEAAVAEGARLAAIQAEKDKNYTDAIAKADNLFNEKNYENSRNEYRVALDVKPEEAYPQQRIDEIGTLMAELSAAQKAYEEAVALGDREFRREGWDAAIVAYNEAKQAKADETYPDEQIAKINGIVAERARLAEEAASAEAARLATVQAEKDKNYADAIAKADNSFNENNYENARNEYRVALDVKPEEAYPQQRIDEIGTLMAELSAAQKTYEEAIAKADREFGKESFDAAIVAYNEAKQAKADETYPDEQIAKINGIVAERARLAEEAAVAEGARLAAIQAEKDKNYTDAIAKADNLFNEKNYENSRNEYRVALDVKPEEAYPQQRIDEIGTLMAELSAAQKAYEEAVALGDREFRREGWDAANVAYKEAKQAKADETYPDEQIAKINGIVAERARLAEEAAAAEAARLAAVQAEKDKNYADAIAKADNSFNENNYENARNEYRDALDVKPEEAYPQQRIDEIEGILRELAAAQAAQAELDKAYLNFIQQADRFFNAQNYASAKDNYSKAAELKPEETYPPEKLAEIEQILEQQAINEKYRSIIVVADGYFRTQKYDDARLQYELALGVKEEEQYPRTQIMKIDEIRNAEQQRILAEQATAEDLERRKTDIAEMQSELDEQRILEERGVDGLYDELIVKADAFFGDKQYNVSRAWYFKAKELKPEESYPPQRIDEINRILSGLLMSQRDREYQKFVDLGDTNFRDNELAVARGWYNQALSQKPNEEYPKTQLSEIARRVAERVAGQSQQQFQSYKETADIAFEAKDYNVARFWYKKALELRENDEDIKGKLNEINQAGN